MPSCASTTRCWRTHAGLGPTRSVRRWNGPCRCGRTSTTRAISSRCSKRTPEHWEAALAQFRAMRKVAPARAFSYWSAVADTLNQLGDRDERAGRCASGGRARRPAPRSGARAKQLAYFAQTDMTVQFVRDSDGREHMVTTRVPHQTSDWNPFVEAGDELRRVRGALREIDCGRGAGRAFASKRRARCLTLAIVDPSRVRMRNAPDELVCGPQSGDAVLVEYACIEARRRGWPDPRDRIRADRNSLARARCRAPASASRSRRIPARSSSNAVGNWPPIASLATPCTSDHASIASCCGSPACTTPASWHSRTRLSSTSNAHAPGCGERRIFLVRQRHVEHHGEVLRPAQREPDIASAGLVQPLERRARRA